MRYIPGEKKRRKPDKTAVDPDYFNPPIREIGEVDKSSVDDINIYYNLKDYIYLSNLKPTPYIPKPTEDDYKKGFIKRYFIFKRNDPANKLIEIDSKQYATVSKTGSGIDGNLYEQFYIDWKITGPINDLYNDGLLKIPGIYDTNKRVVENIGKKYPVLSKFIRNYLQFSRITVFQQNNE